MSSNVSGFNRREKLYRIGIILIMFLMGVVACTYTTLEYRHCARMAKIQKEADAITLKWHNKLVDRLVEKRKTLAYIDAKIPHNMVYSARLLTAKAIFDAVNQYPVYQDKHKSIDLIVSIIRIESNFRTAAKSSAGAIGLMQLRPSTASYMHDKLKDQYDVKALSGRGLYDPYYNIQCGSRYLYYLYHDVLERDKYKHLSDDERDTIMILMYNFGPENQQFKSIINTASFRDYRYYRKVNQARLQI